MTRVPEEAARLSPPILSIIVPVYNEARCLAHYIPYFYSLIDARLELIFVDGGSTDTTVAQLERETFRLLHAGRGRAKQMNCGAAAARADTLLFLHVDTQLPRNFSAVIDKLTRAVWGYFPVLLNNPGFAYRLVSHGINFRSRMFGVATGDQAMFMKKSVFVSLGGFPELPLMEDIAMSRRLKKRYLPLMMEDKVTTSARRWETHGVVYTVFFMWFLQLAYKCGVSPHTIARWYA